MKYVALILTGLTLAGNLPAQNTATNAVSRLAEPLSLAQALNLTLQQNATILKAKNDLESSYGLVVQTRAVALPQVTATGKYTDQDQRLVETFPGANYTPPHQNWNAGVQVVQSIYEGGKITAALKAAKVTKQQALAQYQTVIADTLLNTRVAYYDVLLDEKQIAVEEASVTLLQKELEDQQHRFDAGTVPKFNVLRAEVSVANERPALIRAKNDYRIAKNNLANLLGYDLPRDIWENIPFNLTDTLETTPYDVNLPDAIQQALGKRTELVALRQTEELQRLNIINARSGYQPVVQLFAGYNWNSSSFNTDLSDELHGWNAGAQVQWNIFDGLLTHGKVVSAKADYHHAQTDVIDKARQIELEVRTAYSQFIEAREVLDSQTKVLEQADEALREADARAGAGTGTQLDVLDAETSLTQSRTTRIQAQHDYLTARAKLERAIGDDMIQAPAAKP
jgi:outer membrane protein TolC